MTEEGYNVEPISSEEIMALRKEMHEKGRAMRVDETIEAYRTERKASWDQYVKEQVSRDSIALKRVREKLGIQDEYDERRKDEKEDIIENIKKSLNVFDEKKAKAILEVTSDWLVYGGNLYDHLTGKNIRLHKSVDYKVHADGTPDMESYREARQKKINTWLENPGNRVWLEEGKRFQEENKDKLSFSREEIEIQNSDGSKVKKQRYTTPCFYEQGWLYYESNFFDKNLGDMRQPQREQTKYRVYFDVEGSHVFGTFHEVIDLFENDSVLRECGFQIKTADVSTLGFEDIAHIMHQKDRIVLYVGQKGIERVYSLLQKYTSEKRDIFEKQGVLLAQPMKDTRGMEIPGVSITSEMKGVSPDPLEGSKRYASFSDMQSKIIESSYRSLVQELKNPQVFQKVCDIYPVLGEDLQKLNPQDSVESFLRAIIKSTQGRDFLTKNLVSIYPEWARVFGVDENNIAFSKE